MTQEKKYIELQKRYIEREDIPVFSLERFVNPEGMKKSYVFIKSSPFVTHLEEGVEEEPLLYIAAYLHYMADKIRRGEIDVYCNDMKLRKGVAITKRD